MRVFVAGATGVIGQHLVPGLTAVGHEVTASTRSALKANQLRTTGMDYLASCLGVKPPMRAPVWLGRVIGGELVVSLMTQVRGAANEKAKRELGWTPKYPSWRDGFPAWAETFKSGRAA